MLSAVSNEKMLKVLVEATYGAAVIILCVALRARANINLALGKVDIARIGWNRSGEGGEDRGKHE